MDILTNLLDKLSSDENVITSGFISGLFWAMPFDHRLMKNPLSHIFSGALYGCVYGFLSLLVGSYIPPKIRAIIPITLFMSVIYYKKKEIYDKPVNDNPYVNFQHQKKFNDQNDQE
jgi:glucan phosphoethanolaminetransferase (alkaline phosphatase superfamily)